MKNDKDTYIILSDDTVEAKHLSFDLSEEDEKRIDEIIQNAVKTYG